MIFVKEYIAVTILSRIADEWHEGMDCGDFNEHWGVHQVPPSMRVAIKSGMIPSGFCDASRAIHFRDFGQDRGR